jgi:hypothetical protein
VSAGSANVGGVALLDLARFPGAGLPDWDRERVADGLSRLLPTRRDGVPERVAVSVAAVLAAARIATSRLKPGSTIVTVARRQRPAPRGLASGV